MKDGETHRPEKRDPAIDEDLDALVVHAYSELRRLARRQLRRHPGVTLSGPTGLVHEAYAKLAACQGMQLRGREHLMAVSAQAMRQVLIGKIRGRLRVKRGGGCLPQDLRSNHGAVPADFEQLLDLDRALQALRHRSPQLADIFACRHFGGASEEETARALGLSLRTVQRGWMRARIWMQVGLTEQASRPAAERPLHDGGPGGPPPRSP
jgi:RNA polymerase sigma factor (TIGR02999 family)